MTFHPENDLPGAYYPREKPLTPGQVVSETKTLLDGSALEFRIGVSSGEFQGIPICSLRLIEKVPSGYETSSRFVDWQYGFLISEAAYRRIMWLIDRKEDFYQLQKILNTQLMPLFERLFKSNIENSETP